jgi:DnaJ-class molecular chaperone
MATIDCRVCNGAGKVGDGTISGKKVPCTNCHGTGKVRI